MIKGKPCNHNCNWDRKSNCGGQNAFYGGIKQGYVEAFGNVGDVKEQEGEQSERGVGFDDCRQAEENAEAESVSGSQRVTHPHQKR